MLLQKGAVRLDSLAAERVERDFESVNLNVIIGIDTIETSPKTIAKGFQ